MALTGTLQDLGIVDLVQFPATAKKTGELIVAGLEHEARLYYDNGSLQHIACGEILGQEGLVSLMAWVEGEFEFRQGVTTEQTSVAIPTNELLNNAIEEHKVRETRREAHRAIAAKESEKNTAHNSAMLNVLTDAAEQLNYVEYAALYKRSGELVCVWNRESGAMDTTKLFEAVKVIFDTHTRPGLQKVHLTDAMGTTIATLVNDNLVLLIGANELSSLGMVSLASAKIGAAIENESAISQ